VILEA
jgi:hypothetical protein